ncbi:hypothetical protein MLD52_15315 [Puniceicoccaceae bacterium K14]|nr:hypothetical protein [Puniceicoccaceae bacterium K14]
MHSNRTLVFFCLILLGTQCLQAIETASLRISFKHLVDSKPLTLDSLRYEKNDNERYSISRLSYLISELKFETSEGTWIPVEADTAYIDAGKRIFEMDTALVPGSYRAVRFSIGLSEKVNHSDPSQYPGLHPLNPNRNQLHWTWATGYIFLALEGRFYDKEQNLNAYVYHFANDENKTVINLPLQLTHEVNSLIEIEFDIEKLLGFPNTLSFHEDGKSTHSHEGDTIAAKLRQNLPAAFQINNIQQTVTEVAESMAKPIDLPIKYTPYPFKMSRRFPRPEFPTDNPLIEERIALGETLFFDPQLSRDKTISCASCHQSDQAFSDSRILSHGVSDNLTRRHSMPLFNLAWKKDFFWDGRVPTLREQVFHPIEDPNEMGFTKEELVARLEGDSKYSELFSAAFASGEITQETIGLALENYLLTLVSYKSKFDDAAAGKATLTDQEKRGFELFITEYEPRSGRYGADCFHCHGGALFTDHQFHNNGLPQGEDKGRSEFTLRTADDFKFSTPSLRNVSLTAPYMHDGSLETLEDVIRHYNEDIHPSDTLDPNLAKHPQTGLRLSETDQQALVAFLKTLADPQYSSD